MDPEHESLRDQMRSDFHTVMLGMAAQRDALANAIAPINGALAALTAAVADMASALETFKLETTRAFDEQTAILRGWVERTDARLATLFESDESHDTRLADLEARVAALEKRIA